MIQVFYWQERIAEESAHIAVTDQCRLDTQTELNPSRLGPSSLGSV
jgi:hypothetical protein